ncbi:MAG: ParB N-terminal domain-containing protein [Bryobacterales bacterium]|nr:ParB N-terminal domain-containing protein [Bryobacterales bacterium]
MANDVRAGFQLKAVTLPLGNIVPTKQVTPGIRLSVKYKQIAASVAEVGVIEPLVVYPMNGAAGKYVLLDGHLRLDVLKQNGATEARCIVSFEEEGFTYNKKVNHLATIQEHYMILRAIENGVSEQRIAKALNVNVSQIRKKVNLLDGICPEAVELLKNKQIAPGAFKVLKKMKSLRQVEVAELLVAAGNFSLPYVRALYAATNRELLVGSGESKKAFGLTPEQLAKMEREVEGLQRELKLIEESYGTETLNLVLARAYLLRLLSNSRVMRYLNQHHADLVVALKTVVEEAGPELQPAQG